MVPIMHRLGAEQVNFLSRRNTAGGFDRPLYLSLTYSLNVSATTPVYVCASHWRGENLVGRRQEYWMRRLITGFLKSESGATAIEYCLIAAGISIVIVVAVNGMGSGLNEKFTSVNASIK